MGYRYKILLGLILIVSVSPFLVAQTTLHVVSDLHVEQDYDWSAMTAKGAYAIGLGGISNDGRLHPSLVSADLGKKKRKRLFLLDGGPEWHHGKPDGFARVRSIDDQLDESLRRDLIIGKGCAGPRFFDIEEDVTIVFLSSPYLLHQHYKPQFADTDCDYLYEQDIYAELDDILDDAQDRTIILSVYHNPIAQHGASWRDLLAPYYGLDYQPFSAAFDRYKRATTHILEQYPGTIVLSSADGGPAYDEKAGVRYVNFPNGEVCTIEIGADSIYLPRLGRAIARQGVSGIVNATKTSVGQYRVDSPLGQQYAAGRVKRWMLGDNYRKEWTTNIVLPELDLSNLSPYKQGGGNQTLSLRFKDKEGQRYSFRSIDKDARKNPHNPALQSIFGGVKQDQISSQYPLGDVFTGHLLDATDILHVVPKAYYLAADADLGPFSERFAGMAGTLELRPAGSDKVGEALAFAKAEDILSTHEVYKALIDDGDNDIDGLAVAKEVLFSMWIADWDRHQDNYKWASYDIKGGSIFRPIPRDRDHVLAIWEGLIGNLGDQLAPNVSELAPTIRDVPGLTNQGRAMLHVLTNHVSVEEWTEAAAYLQATYDSTVIAEAWSHLPTEYRHYRADRVHTRLLSRLATLDAVVVETYRHLNQRVDIYATDNRDVLTIEQEEGAVVLTLWEEDDGAPAKDMHWQQRYNPNITQEVSVYLLGKDDVVINNLKESPGFDLRIVGGTGEDVYPTVSTDDVTYYDTEELEGVVHLPTDLQRSVYDFNYDALLALPYVLADNDFGAGAEILLTKYKQSWNRTPYDTRHRWAIRYYPRNTAIRLGYKRLRREVYRQWHADTYARLAFRDTRADNYTGINQGLPADFVDERLLGGRYYVDNTSIDLRQGLRRELFGKSDYRAHLGVQYLHIFDKGNDETLLALPDDNVQVYHHSAINLDFTDRTTYPTSGALYRAEGRLGYTLTDDTGWYYLIKASTGRIFSWRDISKTIVLVHAGLDYAAGELRYYNYPSIGNGRYLRGTLNDVIRTGFVSYVNTELRKEVHNSKNRILPFTLGISGHYDRVWLPAEIGGESGFTADGYGGGAYMTFLDHSYSIYCTYSRSTIDVGGFTELGIGFRLD